jgi:hypothetical protein
MADGSDSLVAGSILPWLITLVHPPPRKEVSRDAMSTSGSCLLYLEVAMGRAESTDLPESSEARGERVQIINTLISISIALEGSTLLPNTNEEHCNPLVSYLFAILNSI